jgi:hypothetical protein
MLALLVFMCDGPVMQKNLRMTSLPLVAGSLALLLSNACVGDDRDHDDVGSSETGDGDGDPTGDGDPGDGDGDPGDGDGDGDPGDGDGDPGDGDGDPGDGDGDGDGGPGDPIEQACAQACAVFDMCVGEDPDCINACVGRHLVLGDDQVCVDKELALTECMATLDCAQLQQFLASGPGAYPCQAENEATCAPLTCSESVTEGDTPGECSVVLDCEDDDSERSVECNGASCICYVDGFEIATCDDALGVCANPGIETWDVCCA